MAALNPKDPNDNKNIRDLFSANIAAFFREIIEPVRYVLANLVVSVAFLLASELIFNVINLTAADLKKRVEFVGWMLDGAQFVSLLATLALFVINTVIDFIVQWKLMHKSILSGK